MFDKFHDIKYTDYIQLDGAYSVAHINYGKSPAFHGENAKNIAKISRKNSITTKDKIDDVLENVINFDGTEKDYKMADQIYLWQKYWFESIDAFDKSMNVMPNSVVTVYIGRHAIELGLKYLIMKKNEKIVKSRNLNKLYKGFVELYQVQDKYMKCVGLFCEKYCEYIEGDNPEYFRYPKYKNGEYFAGNNIDIEWICYNFSLIILKLLHFSGMEDEYKKINSK